MAKQKHPGGRPSEFNPKHCRELEQFMENGLSFEAFAGHIGVAVDTLNSWANHYPEFAASKKIGQAKSRKYWEDLGKKGATMGKQFNATVWIFTMKNRFGWKDQLAISTDSELPITVSYDHGAELKV